MVHKGNSPGWPRALLGCSTFFFFLLLFFFFLFCSFSIFFHPIPLIDIGWRLSGTPPSSQLVQLHCIPPHPPSPASQFRHNWIKRFITSDCRGFHFSRCISFSLARASPPRWQRWAWEPNAAPLDVAWLLTLRYIFTGTSHKFGALMLPHWCQGCNQ